MSTLAFTVCFAVWSIFSIIGIQIKTELGLSDTQFGLLVGTPILTGSLSRLFLGVWTDQYGGRLVFSLTMICAGVATFLLSYATSYELMLLAGLGVGLSGGSFAIGVDYVSKWYPTDKQGTALGIFGAGNVGAAVTKLVAPFVLVAYGWTAVAQVWAVVLIVMAIVFWLVADDDPHLRDRRARHEGPRSTLAQLEPLKHLQVWRFALYYFFVFGAFVALALWLPNYLVNVYGLDIKTAGILAAAYSIPASIFRAYGGHLSDRYGARQVMYVTLGVCMVCLFMLSYPETDYVIHGIRGPIAFSTSMGLVPFVVIIFLLGFFMSLGKAAVFKHVPAYYPDHVGSVGGLVGMIGGLGGFFLPIAFGVMNDLTGLWTGCYMLLFGLVVVAFTWMHIAVHRMELKAAGTTIRDLPEFPEMEGMTPAKNVLHDWQPEDSMFWKAIGANVANRNLWISIPCLLLAFAVWMVWSVVVARLPAVGFDFSTDQLFWLAALPGLSGATLRIFYSFMVPIFGGRLWTTLSTLSLLIPCFGIGYAVQNPETPYVILLILALLCGLGGGNFSSSMANISFFFPKKRKGSALALNAGLGNTGVSVMQFAVPIAITFGIFGTLGGPPQELANGETLWLQNAGFIWVPFIIISAAIAWFEMNDIPSAKASFSEQAVIFQRKHNWIMCVLYTGTFGSFIGYSAGFPLLAGIAFPDTNVLAFAFLGPLAGAISRAATGRLADKWGGGRVTFCVFVSMIPAILGVLYFLTIKDQPGAFWGFFTMFMLLFIATGVGNASTFQMIPIIMRQEMPRLFPDEPPREQLRQAETESAAIIGFTAAIAAYGAFFIPKSYGTSIQLTGGPEGALLCFLAFYGLCAILTWYVYTRRGGFLYEVERGSTAQEPVGSTT
ncbi:MAG: MFS transporter [Gammaproteobacteria bacterium]|nr:MFS transporter [Gammaproteobacteria bacterium]MDH3507002.1 MFS transporter [Gammaproteobacteria bacterium]